MTEEQRVSYPMTRQEARKYLRTKGWLGFEIVEMLRKTRQRPDGSIMEVSPLIDRLDIAYIGDMIEERSRAFEEAKAKGIRGRGWVSVIRDDMYRAEGLVDVMNKPDFWAYFRQERDKSIDSGDYIVPLRKKPRADLTLEDIRKGKANAEAQRQKIIYTRSRSPAPEIGHTEFNEETGKFEVKYN